LTLSLALSKAVTKTPRQTQIISNAITIGNQPRRMFNHIIVFFFGISRKYATPVGAMYTHATRMNNGMSAIIFPSSLMMV